MRRSLYDTVIGLVVEDLLRRPTVFDDVRALTPWLTKIIGHFCNSHRDKINVLVGVTPTIPTTPFTEKEDTDNGTEIGQKIDLITYLIRFWQLAHLTPNIM